MKDRHRSGRPITVESDVNVAKMQAILDKDNRATIREVVKKSRLTTYTVFKIINVVLGLTVKCAKWVSRILTKLHKQKWQNAETENIFFA